MSILALATDVGADLQEGAVGQWAENSDHNRWRTLFNKASQLVQISTITVSGPTNSHTYTVTITTPGGSFDVTYTSDGSATTQEVVDGLVAAINSDPRIRGDLRAVSTSSTVVTLTGLYPGRTFTITESETDLAVATTQAAAVASAVAVGRAMISQGFNTGEGEELGAVAASSLLTPQVLTIAFGAFVDAQVNRFKVFEVRGTERKQIADVSEAAATSRDATIDALVTLLNAALPTNTVDVAADNATATALVFTAEIAGYEFDVEFEAGHEGASLQTLTATYTTGPNPSTSIHQALRGVSLRPLDEECPTIGGLDPQWAANHGVRAGCEGVLYVADPTGVTPGAPAFLELAGSDAGKFFMTGSATRVQLPLARARWHRAARNAVDGVALLRLNIT